MKKMIFILIFIVSCSTYHSPDNQITPVNLQYRESLTGTYEIVYFVQHRSGYEFYSINCPDFSGYVALTPDAAYIDVVSDCDGLPDHWQGASYDFLDNDLSIIQDMLIVIENKRLENDQMQKTQFSLKKI